MKNKLIPDGFVKIKGFEKYYINNKGIVLTTHYKEPRVMVGSIDKDGYKTVGLYKSPYIRVRRKVHRLVAEMFIPNPKNYPIVNHLNGVKDDNRFENLEWTTHSGNAKHLHHVLDYIQEPTTNTPIKLKHMTSGEILEFKSRKECAEHFKYTPSHLSRLTSGLVRWEASKLKDYHIIE